MARAAIVLTVVGSGISSGVAFAGPEPSPVVVTCGEVITTSITVANNLTCIGDALSVQADDVTLDLGGHTIRGSGSGVGVQITSEENPQVNNVTVTNGTISHFDSAVQLQDAENPTLSHLLLTNNTGSPGAVIQTGPGGAFADGVLITDTRILHTTGQVIYAQLNVGSVTISNTRISGGTVFFSQSVGPVFTGDTIVNTQLTFNVEGDTTITGSKFVNSPVVNNGFGFGDDVFTNDTFSGAATALTLADVASQQLTGDTFTGNDIGVALSDSPGDTVSGDTFNHNRTAGVYFIDTNGPVTSTGPLITVSGNKATANGENPDGTLDPGNQPVAGGIYLYTPNGGAVVTDNKTVDNGGYGIYAPPPDPSATGNISVNDLNGCFPLNLCTYK